MFKEFRLRHSESLKHVGNDAGGLEFIVILLSLSILVIILKSHFFSIYFNYKSKKNIQTHICEIF